MLFRLTQGLAITALAACGLLLALVAGPAGGPVAAVFPPWWNATQTVSAGAAGGVVLRPGVTAFVVLVMPDPRQGRERLWRAGAWLLLNASGLIGCGLRTGVH